MKPDVASSDCVTYKLVDNFTTTASSPHIPTHKYTDTPSGIESG